MTTRPLGALVTLSAALLAGCSAAGTDEDFDAVASNVAVAAAPLVVTVVPVAPPCALVLSPDDALLPAATLAAARWSKATGCNVSIGIDGVPIYLVDRISSRDGKSSVLGRTMRFDKECGYIVVDEDATAMWDHVVAHEVGHCLGSPDHSDSGLMADGSPKGSPIDDASLTLECTAMATTSHCTSFVTES